jgi:RNA recognition motif-containing protein
MDKRLFVAGIPFSFDEASLKDLFSKYGTVESATIITDRESGRSKGFGFVEMSTPEEANSAIEKLNNTKIEDRNIVVNMARPREERPRDNFRRGFGGGRGGRGGDRSGGRGYGNRPRGKRW